MAMSAKRSGAPVLDVVVDDRQTGARRHDDLETVERHRPTDVADARPRQLEHLVTVVALADDREFVAREAGQHVVGSQERGQPLAHHSQQLVTGVMAERVVDLLEAVEVEHDHEEVVIAAALGCDLQDRTFERHPIGEPGEGVLSRFALDALVEQPPPQAGRQLLGEVLHPHDVSATEPLGRLGRPGTIRRPIGPDSSRMGARMISFVADPSGRRAWSWAPVTIRAPSVSTRSLRAWSAGSVGKRTSISP
jgi:hypothetical protein